MAADSSLSSVITAIASSLAHAQKCIEEQQIANFISYFKEKKGKDGLFPRRLKIQLPSLNSEAEAGSTDTFCIPYVALAPHSGLKIDTAEISFSVTLGSVEENDQIQLDVPQDNKDIPLNLHTAHHSKLSVDAAGGAFGKKNGLAVDIKLTVSGVDMAEGAARMVNELIKCAQGYKK